MRKAAALLVAGLLVLLGQTLAGMATLCITSDGQVRFELAQGDCCEPGPVDAGDGCCSGYSGTAPERPGSGLPACCMKIDPLLLCGVAPNRVNTCEEDGSRLAAALASQPVGFAFMPPADSRSQANASAPVPRPPPGLTSLRTVVLLC